MARKPLKDLLSISFNQDAGCFSCGLSSGFRIYSSEPFSESVRSLTTLPKSTHTYGVYPSIRDYHHPTFRMQHRREFAGGGGVAIVEMLFRSNILALVGGGPIPQYPPNKVIIWDDHQVRAIGELVCKTPVRAVRLRKDRIAVALEHKVLLYDLEDLRLLHQTETSPNPDGLLALTPAIDSIVMACPGLHAGQVRIDMLDTRRIKIIDAHNSALSAIALSSSGKYVATSSVKGTLIRIFSTGDGAKLKEVRRGSDPAKIFSIAFSRGDMPEWLAVTSDKGTVHVFQAIINSERSGPNGGGSNGTGQQHSGDRSGSGTIIGGGVQLSRFKVDATVLMLRDAIVL